MKSLLTPALLLAASLPVFGQDPVAATIDFEGLAAGTVVSTLEAHGDGVDVGPILVHGSRPSIEGLNTAIIFDSSNPPGIDFDLGTPNERFGGPGRGPAGTDFGEHPNTEALGGILIFADSLHDGDGDGLVDVPNDADETGMVFEFDFRNIDAPFAAGTVTVHSLTALDIETEQDETPATIVMFDTDDVEIATFVIGHIGCNGVLVIPTGAGGTAGVARMEVRLEGSGAIDNIEISVEETVEECVPCEGGVTQLDIQYNGDEEALVLIKRGWRTIFCENVVPGQIISLDGASCYGETFGRKIKLYVDWCYHGKIRTKCYSGIGIGTTQGDFEVVGGSSTAGPLCEEVEQDCNWRCCYGGWWGRWSYSRW